ncbi:unnamed protein product [Didymodactylos carnosus]|uniref:WD repeat-containing protein 82 n=1 Tax=Didymodactylos carnosus TaxID=1234261 RepID=A0A813Z7G3_9BILA|nr:unnamed protein product [Didymodactylos carnosus]CAF0894409.1 unnamed protein product [Didymodactylos carnosus]CAF3497742.1 unnamed protein product [Didymodactylos carnosus]CAF3678051.1 unnamed protein product [Didymodactylos carnosus]
MKNISYLWLQHTSSSDSQKMILNDGNIKSFRMIKVFRENSDRINSLDFNRSGELLISSSDDETIVVYDCDSGLPKRPIPSKKYGCDMIRFTRSGDQALHCSLKVDDSIRYLSLSDSKYIRYYQGHTKKVRNLCVSPIDKSFITASCDHTVRVWDLRSQLCQGLISTQGNPVVDFDPDGIAFGIGIDSQIIGLYDIRNHEKGPFTMLKYECEGDFEWTHLKFSPNGKMILISTNTSLVLLIDAYSGVLLHTFTGHQNTKNLPLEASFSPDSKYIFCGSTDGRIHVWKAENGEKLTMFAAEKGEDTVQCVQFNPKAFMLATASSNMKRYEYTFDGSHQVNDHVNGTVYIIPYRSTLANKICDIR